MGMTKIRPFTYCGAQTTSIISGSSRRKQKESGDAKIIISKRLKERKARGTYRTANHSSPSTYTPLTKTRVDFLSPIEAAKAEFFCFHLAQTSRKKLHYVPTFGGSISGETPPPQYWRTGELYELILSACFTALWSIHTIMFLLESPLQETVTGDPSASTATVKKTRMLHCYC